MIDHIIPKDYHHVILKVIKRNTICIVLLLFFFSCKKELPNTNDSASSIKYFNGRSKDNVSSVIKTKDGGFIFCGTTGGDSAKIDAFLMKTDANGKQQWYKSYGGLNYDEFRNVIQTSDGGYMAVGQTNSIGIGANDGTFNNYDYVVKTDENGTVLWSNSYFLNPGVISSCVESADHYFYLTGSNTIPTSWPFMVNFMKLNANGNRILFKSYSTPSAYPPYLVVNPYHTYGRNISMANDGSVLISGVMSQSNAFVGIRKQVTFLLNTTFNGAVKYLYPYYNYVRDETYYDYFGLPYLKTANLTDGYLIGTYNEGLTDQKIKMELLKTDLTGNLVWEKQYPGLGNALLSNMEMNTDGTILIMGSTSNADMNTTFPKGFATLKTMLLLVDKDGNKIWEQIAGSEMNANIFKCIQPATDGGWMVAGVTTSNESGYDKMFVLKLDKNGKIK